MKISSHIFNRGNQHQVTLKTAENSHHITIPPKPDGPGSSANGGELLMLALATCYCNDVYREAAKTGITIAAVEVNVSANFPAEGAAAENIQYHVAIESDAPETDILALIQHTDSVAEVHNTLRKGVSVNLTRISSNQLANTI